MQEERAFIGISDHGGWAILVTVSSAGAVLDRRRAILVDEDLPKMPHHVEGQRLPIAEAVELVQLVRLSAERQSKRVLDELARSVQARILGVALRTCPELPPTVAERIRDYRARNCADWVMYRRAFAAAAEARGLGVHWIDARTVFTEAARALPTGDLDGHFEVIRKSIGPPWGKDQRLAMAGAMAAALVLDR